MWKRPLRDVVLRCHVGNLRVSGVMARKTVGEAARRWGLPAASEGARLWAEYMAGTVMLSSFFKGEERVKLSVRSPAIREIYAEAMAVGEVRGRAEYADLALLSKPHQGRMQVSKILYGASKPYETTIESFGVPELDWQSFFDQSEQVPTIVRIDSDVTDGEHAKCCGFIVQKMPDATPHEPRYELEDLRFDVHPFRAHELTANSDLVDYLNRLIPDASIDERNYKKTPLDFFCRCSRDGFAVRLQQLGASELRRVAAEVGDAGVDLTCHFCNENYHFPAEELDALISSTPKQP